LPVLQRLADELGPRGASLLTVALEGSPVRYRRAAERLGLRAPVVVGDTALRRDFEVVSYPWTVMIGKDGKAWTALRGSHAEDTLRKAFEEGLR
jgi:hypothetical protein